MRRRALGRATGRGVIAAALAVATLAIGCAEKQVDTSRAESEIRRALRANTGAEIKSVRCPDQVEAKEGAVFRCRATAIDGSRIPIRVTQIDDDGGVRWRIGR